MCFLLQKPRWKWHGTIKSKKLNSLICIWFQILHFHIHTAYWRSERLIGGGWPPKGGGWRTTSFETGLCNATNFRKKWAKMQWKVIFWVFWGSKFQIFSWKSVISVKIFRKCRNFESSCHIWSNLVYNDVLKLLECFVSPLPPMSPFRSTIMTKIDLFRSLAIEKEF